MTIFRCRPNKDLLISVSLITPFNPTPGSGYRIRQYNASFFCFGMCCRPEKRRSDLRVNEYAAYSRRQLFAKRRHGGLAYRLLARWAAWVFVVLSLPAPFLLTPAPSR